jgi:hypothetical protein
MNELNPLYLLQCWIASIKVNRFLFVFINCMHSKEALNSKVMEKLTYTGNR